jgi:hypothetical protein
MCFEAQKRNSREREEGIMAMTATAVLDPRFRVTTPPVVMSGAEAVEELKALGFGFTPEARKFLQGHPIISRPGEIHSFGVVLGNAFSDEDRTNGNILAKAEELGWQKTAQSGIYLRKQITDEEIESSGLKVLVLVHEGSEVLGVSRRDRGRMVSLYHGFDFPEGKWPLDFGFLFDIP